MSSALSADGLLASNQETLTIEGSTAEVRRSIVALERSTGTFRSEVAGGLSIPSLKISVIKLDVV